MPRANPLQPLIDLSRQHKIAKYSSVDPKYIPETKYSDKTANGLTKCVVDFLNLSGHQGERISSSGRWLDTRKTVTNVVGQMRVIGSGKWIPGTGKVGTADISSTIKVNISGKQVGLSVKWEVKMKDRQSEAQREYEQEIKQAAGHYYIIHSFEEFYRYYTDITSGNF